jgi:CoA:oxalate CoA-transferase
MEGVARGKGPLEALTVIDVTHMLAGPYCTWVLGALGADVIKIERPDGGDHTRSLAPMLNGESLYFLSVNRNKRSLTLNLKTADGKRIFRELAAKADVVIENNRPGVMARLGLDFNALAAINPRLVYASVSGFGQTGPYRERPAFDAVIQAMAGMMSLTGEPDRPPSRVGASIGDMTASLFAAIGVLSALQERTRTGRGTFVDVAMLDAQVALLENAFSRYLNTGEIPKRVGSRHPLVTPFQAFATADEPLVICCDTQAQWVAFCNTTDRGDLVEDPRFTDGNSRTRHHTVLELKLAEIFLTKPRVEWLELLQAADVPCGPVNSIADIAADPQIAARQMIVRSGSGRFAAQPVRTPSLVSHTERPAPQLGEHNIEILRALGYEDAEIARLAAGAVI